MTRRVLVTGATSGIGQATVRELLSPGTEVWATARDTGDLADLEEQGAVPVELDLTEQDSIDRAIDRIDPSEDLHGLVHNAGIGMPGAIEDLGPGAWRRQFDVNVFGPVEVTRQLAPAIRARQGRIVLVSSLAALAPVPYYGAYRASKAALEAIGDALRYEMREAGVGVTMVEPGPASTGFQDRARRLLERHVDVEASLHADAYEDVESVIEESVPGVSAEEIANAIVDALTARRAPARVPVGRASWLGTKVLGLLPERLQDRVLGRLFE